MKRDCKSCANCDGVRGFMCSCRYSYDDAEGHHQCGQDVPRSTADGCNYYTEQAADRDKFFIL